LLDAAGCWDFDDPDDEGRTSVLLGWTPEESEPATCTLESSDASAPHGLHCFIDRTHGKSYVAAAFDGADVDEATFGFQVAYPGCTLSSSWKLSIARVQFVTDTEAVITTLNVADTGDFEPEACGASGLDSDGGCTSFASLARPTGAWSAVKLGLSLSKLEAYAEIDGRRGTPQRVHAIEPHQVVVRLGPFLPEGATSSKCEVLFDNAWLELSRRK
jgi:hypothetical protein